jgi:4-amino-4-deoxy-L-arabinose transferase-like glycosyltransferase
MNAGPSFTAANARTVVAAACVALLVISFARPSIERADEQRLREVISEPASEATTLFVHAGGEVWYQPLSVYPSRWLLDAGLAPDVALRVPAMVAGMLTIVLTYMLAVRVSGEAAIGAMSALLLVAMPGFRVSSQAPGAPLLMAPLVLTWLVTVLEYLERPRAWLPFAGGAALGACVYTQPAGVLAVPVFFVLGAVVWLRDRRARTALGFSLIGIAAVVLPAAGWMALHREAYPDTFGRWAIHAAHIRSPWDGIVAFTRWSVVARRVEAYWHYFNPTFLFGSDVLGLPLLVLVPIGVWMLAEGVSRDARAILLGAALMSPLAAVLLDVPRAPALAVMLFAVCAVCAALAVPVIAATPRWRIAAAAAMVVLVALSLTLGGK